MQKDIVEKIEIEWHFEVFHNGQSVALGSAPDRDDAIKEAAHYCMMYGQDGGETKAAVQMKPVSNHTREALQALEHSPK